MHIIACLNFFSFSTPTVNGIDHVIDNPTKFPLPPLSHELTSPYAVAAATSSTPSTLPPTTSQDVTRPDSPQSLQNQALNAAQIVRNHVESLKGFSGKILTKIFNVNIIFF